MAWNHSNISEALRAAGLWSSVFQNAAGEIEKLCTELVRFREGVLLRLLVDGQAMAALGGITKGGIDLQTRPFADDAEYETGLAD